MRSDSIDSVLREAFLQVEAVQEPITMDELRQRVPAVREVPLRSVPLSPSPRRRSTSRPLLVAASVVVAAVMAVGLVWRTSSTSPPATNPDTTVPVVSEETEPPVIKGLPIGSISWEVVDLPDGAVAPQPWPGRQMMHTSSGYHFWQSCEQFIDETNRTSPSYLWSSPDGSTWNRRELPCDDTVIGVADKLVLDSYTRSVAEISDDGVIWQHLTVWGPSGTAIPGTPSWHGSENGYAPSALIWEVDDSDILMDFSMPWDIGFYAPTGWLMAFDDGYTAISRCCQDPARLFDDSIVKYSADGHTWVEGEKPPFVPAGFVEASSLWTALAHQDGVAVVAVSDGTRVALWRTVDGREWVDVTPETVAAGGVWAADTFWVQGLHIFDQGIDASSINISTDGATWKTIEIPADVASADGVVRVGGGKIFIFGDQLVIGTYEQ